MGLDHANDHIDAVKPPTPALGEHFEGLAHARRRAEKNAKLAAPFLADLLQQGVGGWAIIGRFAQPCPQTSSAAGAMHGVQIHIELQDIDMRLADDAEHPSIDMVLDQPTHGSFATGPAPWQHGGLGTRPPPG